MAAGSMTMEVSLFIVVSVLLNVSFGQNLCGEIAGCYCTDTNIDCYNADSEVLGDIIPYITNQVTDINIVNGNIRSIPDGAFFNNESTDALNGVVHLNLSGNGIVEIHCDAFQHLPNLENLVLSNNNLSTDLSYMYTSVFQPMKTLEDLRVLDMDNNNISYIGYMEIDIIRQDLLNLVVLRLGGNPFKCDCGLLDLVDWINTTSVYLDTVHMTCASGLNESLIGEPVSDMKQHILYPDCEPTICVLPTPDGHGIRITRAILIAIIIIVLMTVVAVIAAVILCRIMNQNKNRTQDKTAKRSITKADIEAYVTADVNVSKSVPYKIIM